MRFVLKFLFIVSICFFLVGFSGKDTINNNYSLWDMTTWDVVNYGSNGGFVSAVQSNLWASRYQTITGSIDGSFGPSTENGVKEFQSDERLAIDGSVGPNTWEAFESHVENGFISRTYSHTSSVYTVYYTVYDHGDWAYAEGSLDEHGVPSEGFTLWTEGNITSNNLDNKNYNNKKQNLEEARNAETDKDLHEELMKKRIKEIKNSNFNVNLPEKEANDKKLVNISHKKFDNNKELVRAEYGEDGDYAEGKWDFSITQEKLKNIKTQNEAIQHIKKVNEPKNKIEKVTIKNNPAYILDKENSKKEFSSIWVITDDYGYTITSPSLNNDELKQVANSIDY